MNYINIYYGTIVAAILKTDLLHTDPKFKDPVKYRNVWVNIMFALGLGEEDKIIVELVKKKEQKCERFPDIIVRPDELILDMDVGANELCASALSD